MATRYQTVSVDGLNIFYRDGGPRDGPAILLLHGLPSSSRMFEPLCTRLTDDFRLVAPDYPGFGHSDWPGTQAFDYTFERYAEVMHRFIEIVLPASKCVLYMQDYGGPVGFRLAMAAPERITALIVQNAVSHNEGLSRSWDVRRAFWSDRTPNQAALRADLLSMAAARRRHVGSDPDVGRYDPDLWTDELRFLSQAEQSEIQTDLFYDYRTNVAAYPEWQQWLQQSQPPLLVLWGKYDLSFDLSEPEAYRKDVPQAEIHILDGGHFALDTAADEIAFVTRRFLNGLRMP